MTAAETLPRDEALRSIDTMIGMISGVPRGEVRIERDTMLDLLRAFRSWVEKEPKPAYVHRPFRPEARHDR